MPIIPSDLPLQAQYSTGELRNISVMRVTKVLGFQPNHRDPTEIGWNALVDGAYIAIWDSIHRIHDGRMKTFGDADVFEKLFGEHFLSFEKGWR